MEPLTEREKKLLEENLAMKKLIQKLPAIYVVESGNNLYKIIKKYKGSADELDVLTMIKLNVRTLINPDLIHPGQELYIPREWVLESSLTDQLSELLKKEENNG